MRFIPYLLLILLASCGGSNRVMETGFLQKRKHLPGWDLSIGSNAQDAMPRPERTGRKCHIPVESAIPRQEVDPPGEPITADATGSSIRQLPAREQRPAGRFERSDRPMSVEHAITIERPQEPAQEDLMPRKKWNFFAIPAFLAALGAVALGLFTTSTIAVIVALVITFVLSAISLRQIRARDEAGKGFALIALIIAVLAAVVTAMATAVVGFV